MRAPPTDRLVALDVLRGVAVAGMILVVSPGDWNSTYALLRHAAWNGWTLADLVFPTFLFGVGVALGLSFPRDVSDRAKRRRLWFRIARRTAALVALGLFVEATYVWAISLGAPYPGQGGLAHVRIPGILQRIGVCYALAAAILIWTGDQGREGKMQLSPLPVAVVITAGLSSYWILLTFVPTPGFGPGRLDPEGSLAAWVDRTIFTVPHLWPLGTAVQSGPVTYDPEGLLSSLPATANVLFGALAAGSFRRNAARAPLQIACGGVILVALGLLLDPLFPINKRLWSSTFALFSSGISALALAALMPSLRNRIVSVAATPFRILGANAVLAFLVSTALSRIGGAPIIPRGGQAMSPQEWGDEIARAVLGDPHLASFACAVGIVIVTTLAIWPLHRRAIHFRL